jgi:hypothetical protein
MRELRFRNWVLAGVALFTATAALLAVNAPAGAANPPIVTVGPVSSPGGGVTASADATSSPQANTCLNGQHSDANPSSSGVVQVNNRTCQTSGGSSGSGTGGSGSGASGAGSATAGGAAGSNGTSNAGQTQAGTLSVTAANALGLQSLHIRYLTRAVKKAKRLGVLVTLTDRQGRLVRDAIVSLGGVSLKYGAGRTTIGGKRAAFTDLLGTAHFNLRLNKKMLGKRLVLNVVGRTPSTRASVISSILLAH